MAEGEIARYEVTEVPVALLVGNQDNPNTMDDRTFNALVESIREEGWMEPIQVVPLPDGKYQIVGGHQRVDAAVVLDMETVPAVLLDPEKFDQDRRDWNLVKLNILRGKLDPEKFTRLYNRMAERYGREVLQQLMGFTTEDAFARLYRHVRDSLPPEMATALDEARDEIKTIDDLSLVLNRLFATFGETLPSNMMVFTWGGREVLWIRADDRLWKLARGIADETAKAGGDVAAVFYERLQRP